MLTKMIKMMMRIFLYKDACNCMGKPSADLWMKQAFKPQRYVFTADLLCFHARWFLLCGNMKQFVAIKQLWLEQFSIFCSQILFQHSTTRYSKSSLKDMNEKLPKRNGHKTVECYDFIYAVLLSVCPKCIYPSRGSFSEHKFNPSVESWNESLKNFLRSGTKIISSLEPHELDIG